MENLQKIAYDWGVRCFGLEHMQDQGVRALRMVEEAVEAAQAYGVPKNKMLDLVEIVYGRPPGDPIQELGGVLVTASVLCEIQNMTLEQVFLIEVRRCLAKSPEHFAKRNQEKLNLGLTGGREPPPPLDDLGLTGKEVREQILMEQVRRGEISPNVARSRLKE